MGTISILSLLHVSYFFILHAIALGLIAYGTSDFFGEPLLWWHTAIMILASMMAFGALLEARKKHPLG